jgi:hypothetical protein
MTNKIIDLIYSYFFPTKIKISDYTFISIDDSELKLLEIIKMNNNSLETLTLNDWLNIFYDYYNKYMFNETYNVWDWDMLLYQWGKRGYNEFEISLVRQLIIEDDDGEQIIKQLSMEFIFLIFVFKRY